MFICQVCHQPSQPGEKCVMVPTRVDRIYPVNRPLSEGELQYVEKDGRQVKESLGSEIVNETATCPRCLLTNTRVNGAVVL